MPAKRPAAAALFLGLASLSLAACDHIFISFNPNQKGTTTVSLSLRDTPPAGVTVLSAAITVTGPVLQPGNVALLAAPVRVELNKLQTETLFLNATRVSATTFDGINVALANPQLTILNNSGASVAGCAAGAVCQIQPRLTTGVVFVPLVLLLDANTPTGVVLDFDLSRSLRGDLTIQPAITAAALAPLLATGTLEEVNDFVGQVTSVGSNQFTLKSASSGLALAVQVDGSTQFSGFAQAGLTNSITSVSVGQIIAADLRLLANGTLLARRVTLEDLAGAQVVEGVVVATDAANNRFALVVLDAVPAVVGVAPGNRVTVNSQLGTAFAVDNDGVSVPLGVSFGSAADLLVGQAVQVRALSAASDAAGIVVSTDRLRLRMSQVTASVATKTGNGFTLGALPSIFTSAGVSEIQVPASLDTSFESVSGLAALNPGDVVSLRGLLFRATSSPTLAARKVRKR